MSLRTDVKNLADLWHRRAASLRADADLVVDFEVRESIERKAGEYIKRANALDHILAQNPEDA